MKSLQTYVNEHFVSAPTKEKVKEIVNKYGQDILDIINYGYFYTRDIKGHLRTKIMMGNHLFYNHNIKDKLSDEEISKFKELGKKYAIEDEKLNHI